MLSFISMCSVFNGWSIIATVIPFPVIPIACKSAIKAGNITSKEEINLEDDLYSMVRLEDIDEFNKILGTSEGKGNLLKDLGIILNNEVKIFENPNTESKVAVKQPSKKTTESKKVGKKSTAKKPAKKESSCFIVSSTISDCG